MSRFPSPLSAAELSALATTSTDHFRQQRLKGTEAWAAHFEQARGKFELLFHELNDLNPAAFSDGKLADVYRLGLGEAIRYLAGPPVSDHDLRAIADVDSLSPAVAVLAGVFNVLNLEQAQDRGLALFWSHDLDRLGEFIGSTSAAPRA